MKLARRAGSTSARNSHRPCAKPEWLSQYRIKTRSGAVRLWPSHEFSDINFSTKTYHEFTVTSVRLQFCRHYLIWDSAFWIRKLTCIGQNCHAGPSQLVNVASSQHAIEADRSENVALQFRTKCKFYAAKCAEISWLWQLKVLIYSKLQKTPSHETHDAQCSVLLCIWVKISQLSIFDDFFCKLCNFNIF